MVAGQRRITSSTIISKPICELSLGIARTIGALGQLFFVLAQSRKIFKTVGSLSQRKEGSVAAP